jgi:hypothetical protein
MSTESERVVVIVAINDDDINKAIDFILKSEKDKDLIYHTMRHGVRSILASDRRRTRHDIKLSIQPQFSANLSGTGIQFSKETVGRIMARGRQFTEEWRIGNLVLGNLTKEELLEEARKENKSGAGHILNAKIYTALAEPLDSDQKLRDYWTFEEAEKVAKTIETEIRP